MQKAKFWIPLARHFSAGGRISRLQYFVYSLIYLASYFALLFGAGILIGLTGGDHNEAIALAIVITVVCYVYFCLDAKRLHDLNWPAFIAALMLSEPLISVDYKAVASLIPIPDESSVFRVLDIVWRIGSGIVGLILLFSPGNKGKNKYGPDPLKPPAPPVEVF